MLTRNAVRVGLVAVLLALVCAAKAADKGASAPPRELPPVEAWRQAGRGGKYMMLLRQIRVPADAAKYGSFHDLGPQRMAAYAGHKDLPPGHWVYVYPHWYIWRDCTQKP